MEAWRTSSKHLHEGKKPGTGEYAKNTTVTRTRGGVKTEGRDGTTKWKEGCEGSGYVNFLESGKDFMGGCLSKLTQLYILNCSTYFVNYSSIKPVPETLAVISG